MRLVAPTTFLAVLAVALAAAAPRPASAIPVFAHRYGLTCGACHTTVPRLNENGEAFEAHGYRMLAARPGRVFPIAIKAALAYGSTAEDGLPKAIVDEVEALAGGSIGKRGAYFAEQYIIDGGKPGRTRDLWAGWRTTQDGALNPVWLRAGQQSVALPVDVETMRETPLHYAIFDQTAGENPFSFFDPKTGVTAAFGREYGLSAQAAAVQGHERGSGLPVSGVDRSILMQHGRENAVFSVYRYDGTRQLGAADRFWRQGYGAILRNERAEVSAIYQHGRDSAALGGAPLRSSGGFVQLRYVISDRAFGIVRYEGTQDTEFLRRATAGVGYRLARNMRLAVFDAAARKDGAMTHTLQTSLLFAY